MARPAYTRSNDGRERATVHLAIRVDKAQVQWIARTFNISEAAALRRVREALSGAVREWDGWHRPMVDESGDLDWAHVDDLHELAKGTYYEEGGTA